MKNIYRWFAVIFLLFAFVVVVIQLDREKQYTTEALCAELNAYAHMCDAYMKRTADTVAVAAILPRQIRFTLVDRNGRVQYDNVVHDVSDMPSHLDRPEVVGAMHYGTGYAVRLSSSVDSTYLYYALKTDNGEYIRVAMPYRVTFKDAISKETFLIYGLTLLLLGCLLILLFYRERLGKKILKADEQLEDTMRQAALQQEKNRKLKREMTNNIAHELKTPVSSIRGFLEILSTTDNIPEEKKRYFIERAYQQTLRLSDLVTDIALITKLEEAETLFPRETVNLRAVAEEAVAELEPALTEASISLTDDLPAELQLSNANHSLLFAVFRNLVENTVRYAGKGVQIVIRVEDTPADGYVHIEFYDTGKGVPEDCLERIFGRFERLDKGRDRRTGGTGLGLSIVKHAVSFHHGSIKAQNRPGGGLAFYFTLAL